MKEIGDLTKLVDKVNFGMSMEMFLRASGSTTRLTDMESMFTKTVPDMKENGKTISSTVKEKRSGPTTPCTKVITTRERSMEKAFIFGRMDQAMKATGLKIELKVQEFINGRMAGRTLVNGKIITCMEKVSTPGQMAEGTKVNTRWIKNMAMAFTSGPMVESTRASG